MNRSDGGKNRPAMDTIGLAGLDRVLTAMDKDPSQLDAEGCRQVLWECDVGLKNINDVGKVIQTHQLFEARFFTPNLGRDPEAAGHLSNWFRRSSEQLR
jgi:hypothetical protein